MKPFRCRFRREFAKLIRFVESLDFATDTLAATAPATVSLLLPSPGNPPAAVHQAAAGVMAAGHSPEGAHD